MRIANQEILSWLIVAGSMGLAYALPSDWRLQAFGMVHCHTIRHSGYPSGGGSYIVARRQSVASARTGGRRRVDDRLRFEMRRLVWTAGVAALASAFPVAAGRNRVPLALALLLITLVTLRGLA